jgi:hypothetical protein
MNNKLLALGAQKGFQGEREREKNESGLKISRSQIGRSDVASLALSGPWFYCLLAHVFRPCHAWFCMEPDSMVLRVFLILQNNLVNCSFISPSFFFCSSSSPAKSNSELYRYGISFKPLG